MINIMNSSLIQLQARGGIDDNYIGLDKTFFKNDFNLPMKFYKQYDSEKSQIIKFDDSLNIDLNYKHHYLQENYIKVKIPYFQMFKNKTTVSSTTDDYIINKIIYDNHDTFLFIINSKFYLIPEFLLKSNLSYGIEKIEFSKIKEYFNSTLEYYISDSEYIYFASFEKIDFITDLIPLFLTFNDIYNKHYLQLINNNMTNKQLNTSLLTSTTFNKYLENIIKNNMFHNYQNFNHYDNLTKYYDIITDEVKYFIEHYINNKPITDYSFDAYKANEYYNTHNYTYDLNTYIEDTIKKNSLILHYILNNLYSSTLNTFTFYKKYITSTVNYEYEVVLVNSDINDINSLGGNLISRYYPKYTLKLETDLRSEYYNLPVLFKRLPFNFDTNMSFRTINNKSAVYQISNDVYTLTFSDSSTYEETNITLLVTTDNTKNEATIDTIVSDNNVNTEFVNNITTNLSYLDYNFNINMILFNKFKELYFGVEQFVKTYLFNLSLTQEQIKNIFIGLKVYEDKFKKNFTEINFADNDAYTTEFNTVLTNYPDLYKINTLPQDLYNIYILSLLDFKNEISLTSIFSDTNFIDIYFNKIISFFYNRYVKVSNLDTAISSAFNGLLFYFNIDNRFYINKQFLRDSFDELFNRKSFIGYSSDFPKLNFSHNIVKENVNEFYNNTNFVDNNICYCFNDFTVKNTYDFSIEYINFTFSSNKITLSKKYFNTYYYKDNLTKFSIYLTNEDKNLNVVDYSLDANNLILTLSSTISSQPFKLSEFINSSIPLIHFSTTNSILQNFTDYGQNNLPINHLSTTDTTLVGLQNDNIRYELYNKDTFLNKFIDLNNIYFDNSYNSEYSYFLYFVNKDKDSISFKLRFILSETFDTISYSNAMAQITSITNDMVDKLNILKDVIEFKNLIIGETNSGHIDYYFKINKSITLNEINTKLSGLTVSILYYVDLSTSSTSTLTLSSVEEIKATTSYSKIVLEENGVGFKLKDKDNTATISVNYNDYDNIYLDVIKLPVTKNLTIDNDDCVHELSKTFPYVFLKKSSTIYTENSSLFSSLNTISNFDNNNPVKIVDITSTYIKLHVIGTLPTRTVGTNINIEIFDNSYLPNFYNYTSKSDSDISIVGDFMYQKPTMFKIYSKSDDTPLYLFYNIMKHKETTFYESTTYFINGKSIYELYNIDSNQLNRDTSTNTVYSTTFDKFTLEQHNSNILSDIMDIYDNIFNNDYKSKVIDVIEKSFDKYIDSHKNILDALKKTDNYGMTISKVYDNIEKLNKFKTINGDTTYTLKFDNFNLFEYDYYSIFAFTLYNHTNFDVNIKNDKVMVTNLNSKYNISKVIINYPWVGFSVENKINSNVNKYLLNFNTFITNQINYCKDNNIVDKIVNNNLETESTNIGKEDDFRSKYINNIYNFDNAIISLQNNDIYTSYLSKNINTNTLEFKDEADYIKENTFVETYYNNEKIPLKYENSNYITKRNNNINKSDGNVIYVENKIESNNTFKNIGYIKINDNKIVKYNKINGSYDFVVLNNTIYNYPINDKKYKFYVNGTSASGPTKGVNGYFYPLSTISYGNDHAHTFDEFSGITFYMPESSNNHAQVTSSSSTAPEGYFDYALVNKIKFNNINGIYGKAKALTKSTSNISLILENTYLFYTKLSSSVLSTYLTTGTKYLFKVNNFYSFGKFDGTYLEFLSINELTFNENNILYYEETTLEESTIFTNILNDKLNDNLKLPYTTNFTLSTFTINETDFYNYYCDQDTTFNTYSSYILDFATGEDYPQNYNIHKNILGKSLFNYDRKDETLNNETLNVTVYKSIETDLPPIKVSNGISVYNSTEEVDWLKEGGYLRINSTNYNINDLDEIIQNDNNYACYYVKGNNIPSIDRYSDIYQEKKTINSNIVLNPYTKELVTNKTTIDKDNVLEVNNIKYEIKNISDSTNKTTIKLDYLRTDLIDIIIKDSSETKYFRQIYYVNTDNYFNYTYYNSSDQEVDNMAVIPTTESENTNIFLRKITFDSSHSSETLTFTSSNNNITLQKIDNLNYNIKLSSFQNLITGKEYVTYLNVSTTVNSVIKENFIIFRFIISDTYINTSLSYGDDKLKEPIYISASTTKYIDIDSSYSFSSFDSFYLSQVSDTRLSTKSTSSFDSFKIYGNKYIQFNETNSGQMVIETSNDKNKIVQGEYHNWEYVDNVSITTIDENSTIENDVLLSYFKDKYLPIILVSDDIVYFREIIDIVDSKLKLSAKVTFTQADVYMYPYLPIYMDCNINLEYFDQIYHIHTDNSNGMVLERNEIIKFGTNVLQVLYFSIIKQAYVCSLLTAEFKYFDGSGFYSFGKINNNFDKDKYLASNKVDKLFKYQPYVEMMYGDYYIEENKMKIFRGIEDFKVENVFKNTNGTYTDLIYYNNCFYYDIQKIKIVEGMRLYNNNKQIVVKTVSGNKFTFDNNDSNTFTNYSKYSFYVANHIFETKSILITDYIVNNVKNGFILYENKFYTVTNYKTSIQSLYGNVLVYDVENVDIKYDFNNPYVFTSTQNTFDNTNIPLCLKMNINTDDEIYFYNTLYSEIVFNYCYFQRVLIDGVYFNVTRIENNRIYINNTIDTFKLKVKTGDYEVLLSSFNVNNRYFVSNNYSLNPSSNYNYPTFNNNSSNLNILFYNSNNTNNYTYNYTETELVRVIKNNKFMFLTQAEKLNEIKNNSDVWDEMNRLFFTDNYIRLSEDTFQDDSYSIYLKSDNLSLNTLNNVIIEEISGNEKYIHIVNIEIVNNFMKIKDNYEFENINDSIFYLHKVVPIRITGNNYIQVLRPEFYEYREINNNNNILKYKVFLRITFDTKPIYNKTTKLWKYNITIHSPLNLKYVEYLYFDNYEGDTIKLTLVNDGDTTEADYHVTTSYLFNENDKTSHFYYNSDNYISTVNYSTLTTKDEYDLTKSTLESVFTENPTNKYKLLNKCSLNNTNSNYYFSIKNNDLSNLNIGKIEGDYYFNNTNEIENFELTSSKTYFLLLKSNLFDIDNNETIKSYIYYKDINLADKYYIKPKEVSVSVKSMIRILNDNNIDIKLIVNSLKPWKDWSLLSLSNDSDFIQYVKNYKINYNGSTVTYTLGTTSYFTNSEVTLIKTFLENTYEYKSHYYSTLSELHTLETFLIGQIKELINTEYFWNNINTIIELIVKNYNSTNNWVFYNNTLMIDYGTQKEIDRYPDLFENGKRKYYLSNDITITDNNDIVSISRPISKINNNVSLFLSGSSYNLNGTSMDILIETIKNMSENRLKLVDSDNNYFNHKYPSILKFLINRQFSKFIDDDTNGLNRLNNDFYKIQYTQNITNNSSGQYIDNMFNVRHFGLKTNGKIKLIDFNNIDKFNVIDLNKNKDVVNEDIDIKNSITSDPIFYYKVNFNDDTSQILTSSSEYSIEYPGSNYSETNNKINKVVISKPEIYSDSIIFYSNELIKDTDITVNVKDKYTIKSFVKNGSLYELSISSLTKITKDSEVYFNDYNKAKLLEITTSTVKLLSSNIIDSLYNMRIIDLCKVISTSQESSLTYIKLSSNIASIFIEDNTYININNKNYMLYFENNRYYIDALVTIKNNRLYRVTRNIDITEVEVKSLYVADVVIDKNLEHYYYYNQTDNNLDEINFTSSKLHIKDADLLSKSEIRIYYHMDNLSVGDIITHSYNIRQSQFYNITDINNMDKYLYNLDMDLSNKNKNNITMTIGDYSCEIVENKLSSLSFYLTSFISPIALNKLQLVVKYTYSLTNISTNGNTIYCSIPSDFILNSTYTYYINGTIEATITVTNRLNITVSDIDNIDLDSSITLVEEGIFKTGKFEITKPVFNNLVQIDLTKNYNPKNKSSMFNNYISVFDKNISGGIFNYTYYYKFTLSTSSSVTFTDYMYLIYNDVTYKVRIIMIQQDGDDYTIKIGSDELFEVDTQVNVYTEDTSLSSNVTLIVDNINLIKCQYYKNIDNNTLQLYVNNNLSDYDNDNNVTDNDYIMYTKYSDIIMKNNSYNNVGFNKVDNSSNDTTTIVTEYKDVNFVEDVAYKFFKNIEFTINNKTLEKLDYDAFKILYSYYNYRYGDITDLFKIKKVGNFYEFTLLLPFFFTKRITDSLPLHLLQNENIKIKFVSDKLKNLIDKTQYKDYKVSKNVKPIIEYHYSYNNMNFRELEKVSRKLIDTMYVYQTIKLGKTQEYNTIKIPNRVKEFYIAIKNKYVETSYEYDSWYSLYLTNYEKYKNQTKESKSIYEIEDYYIFRLVDDEVKNKSNRYNQIINHPVLKNYDAKYVIYLDEKYLDYINENVNNLTVPYSNKLTILSLYFKNIYKNNKIETKVNLIDKIKFDINGINFNVYQEQDYYNKVVPYYTGENIDEDYLLYSLNFTPLEEQPTGFYKFDENRYLGITTILNISTEPVFIKILTKEYKYLVFNE